jgi:hypothetical protein
VQKCEAFSLPPTLGRNIFILFFQPLLRSLFPLSFPLEADAKVQPLTHSAKQQAIFFGNFFIQL